MSTSSQTSSSKAPVPAREKFNFNSFTADELLSRDFPENLFVVGQVLVEGLTVLAGKPKVGKSWLLLDLARCVAMGAPWNGRPIEAGDVLYLALEDNERRLKSRLQKVGCETGDVSRLQFAVQSPTIGLDLTDAVDDWVNSVEDAKLLIIDTYSKIRPRTSASTDDYSSEYQLLSILQGIANRHGISMVLVHHLKKEATDDPFDSVLGSTAITGAADSILILRGTTKGHELLGRGRDIEEFELAVKFEKETCQWEVLGDVDEVSVSETRKKILKAVGEGNHSPMDVAIDTGIKHDSARQEMGRMVKDGSLCKAERGSYQLPN